MYRYGPAVEMTALRRLPNSPEGNPRWNVQFHDGTHANTDPNSAVGGVINNPEFRYTQVRLAMRKGLIVHLIALMSEADNKRFFDLRDKLRHNAPMTPDERMEYMVLSARIDAGRML